MPHRPTSWPPLKFGAIVVLIGLATAALASTQPADPFTPKERAQGFRDRVILAKPRATHRAEADAGEARERVRVREKFARFGDLRVVELDATDRVEAAIARLRATGRYEFVEPDYLMTYDATPNDPRFPSQWSLENTGQVTGGTPGVDLKARAAWDVINSAPGVIVAVVDTGINRNHEDIAANLWTNPAPTVGDTNGISIVLGARSGDLTDDGGHGSHVAGIIGAAGNNGLGIAGIAWRVQLMILKNGTATGSATSDSAACIDYAIARGAHVINCSFGGTGQSQTFLTALRAARNAGILVVVSAGNAGVNNDLAPHFPSNYLLDNILSVGNSTASDAPSSTSDFGGLVELFAPAPRSGRSIRPPSTAMSRAAALRWPRRTSPARWRCSRRAFPPTPTGSSSTGSCAPSTAPRRIPAARFRAAG